MSTIFSQVLSRYFEPVDSFTNVAEHHPLSNVNQPTSSWVCPTCRCDDTHSRKTDVAVNMMRSFAKIEFFASFTVLSVCVCNIAGKGLSGCRRCQNPHTTDNARTMQSPVMLEPDAVVSSPTKKSIPSPCINTQYNSRTGRGCFVAAGQFGCLPCTHLVRQRGLQLN